MSTEQITSSIITEMTSEAPVATEATTTEESVSTESSLNADPNLSRGLAILAKKEKALLQRQQEMSQRFKELEDKYSKLSQWENLDKLVSENPAEFFKQKGLSFEQLQQKMLESIQDEDLDPIQKQIKELQNKLNSKDEEYKKLLEETLSKREVEEKNKQIEEQSKYYSQELAKYISENTEKYDLINMFEAKDEVFEVIKSVYLKTADKGTPKLMSFEEACDLYEKKLEDMMQSMKKSKKVSKMFGVEEDSEDLFGKVYGQSTIDDSFSQSSSTSTEYKTEQERLKAAAKLFEQQIKAI
jgi:hypothetical protein